MRYANLNGTAGTDVKDR